MKTAVLRVSPGLELPIDAATETFAILAKRGAGKSNAAVVLAEQMHDAGVPWVAVDPKGDWWGIRSSKDGSGAGLPVLVLGGQHGDVPLEPTGGHLVADLIATQRLTCVVDVSLMSKSDMRRFLADFAERLYTANTEPLHVFAEEAHEYIPQRVDAGAARMVGAWEKLVKWGRTHGLGVTLITQRSASLNKDVLTQVETLIALRTTGPQDQAAIRAWVDEHESGAAMIAQLRKLGNGEAFVLSPQWLELEEPLRIRFDQRRTFDSGATPRAGQKRVTPRTFAEVDLAALKEQMAETVEKARASDPVELRKHIARLQRQLTEAIADKPEPVVEFVEIPIVTDATLEKYSELAGRLLEVLAHIEGSLAGAKILTDRLVSEGPATLHHSKLPTEVKPGQPTPRSSAPRHDRPADTTRRARVAGSSNTRENNPPAGREMRPAPAGGLPRAQAALLAVLAQHDEPLTAVRLSLLSGYSAKSSSFKNALGALRSAGYVIGGKDAITATPAGVDLLGDDIAQMPTGGALVAHWMSNLGKAERALLEALLAAWPNPWTYEELSVASGYSATSSSFKNALGRLRTLQLATGGRDAIYAADELGQAHQEGRP